MESIGETLDETLSNFFDILDQLYKQQARLEDLMKSGFLDLSRSRYNMGTNSVSPAQFSEEMQALVKVDVHQENGNTILELKHTDTNKNNQNDESSLRKRNVVNVNDKNDKTNVESIGLDVLSTHRDQNSEEGRCKKTVANPINWFGVLVPQNLRRSQGSFKAAIEVSVTIANLKLRLYQLKTEYRELLVKKDELIKEDTSKQSEI